MYNRSYRRKVFVASVMEIQVMYVKARGVRYMYGR